MDSTTQQMLNAARTQYRAMFYTMAVEGGHWHLHHIPGTPRVCLMRDDALWDIPEPPVVVPDVHAMTEEQLTAKLAHAAPRLVVRSA